MRDHPIRCLMCGHTEAMQSGREWHHVLIEGRWYDPLCSWTCVEALQRLSESKRFMRVFGYAYRAQRLIEDVESGKRLRDERGTWFWKPTWKDIKPGQECPHPDVSTRSYDPTCRRICWDCDSSEASWDQIGYPEEDQS